MKNPRKPLHGDRPELGQLPVEEDVRKELDFHLEMRAQELIDLGWDPGAARSEADRLFGNMTDISKECRDITRSADRATRRAHRLDAFGQDVRYALRTLSKTPSFTIIALITLALGMGANTAIFSVINGVLLRPLPYSEPGSLVWINEHKPSSGMEMPVAIQNFSDWREQTSTLSGLAALGSGAATIVGDDGPVRASSARVTEDFWSVMGARPVIGRVLTSGEHASGTEPLALIREDLWRTVFSGRPLEEIRFETGGQDYRVVGVLPESFAFPFNARIWIPLIDTGSSRSAHNYRVVGRLAPSATIEQVDAELDAIQARVTADITDDREFIGDGVAVRTLLEQVAGSARQPLYLLFGAAALVLLVACTNLASTLLARGASRARELAVRSAIGATRRRIVRQLLTESLLLAGLGGIAGVAVAALALRAVRALGAASIPRLEGVVIDGWVLTFTLFITLATAVLFGLLPSLRLTRQNVAGTLRTGDRGSAGGKTGVWTALIASEVALAFVLLTGSGLLIRSFQQVLSQERGFDTEPVLTVDMALSLTKYPEGQDHARFYGELLSSLQAAPEIESAGIVSSVPMSGMLPNGRLELDGDLSKHATSGYAIASGGYFEAMGIPLLQGRLFDRRDGPEEAHVAIVSRAFADRFWPGEDPIGKQVSGGGMDEFWQDGLFATVVGVVGDARYRSLTREPRPVAYFPFSQRPGRLQYSATVVARNSQGTAASSVSTVRQALSAIDPTVPPRVRTMEDRIRNSLAERRFLVALLGAFAGIAFFLAAIGIYGVVSYAVARRTREMGVRLALGAHPRQVGRLVQGRAMAMVAAGAALGLIASVGLTQLIRGLLFGVSPVDPITFVGVAGTLLGAAWVASVIPARRSMRVDPVITMQTE